MKQEIWKTMKCPYTKYDISSSGRLRNNITNKIILPEILHKYHRYKLYNEGEKKKILAHRLVAQYFLENYTIECVINHKNFIRSDNRVENLECVSLRENIIHANSGTSRKVKKIIGQYTIDNQLFRIFHRHEVVGDLNDIQNTPKIFDGYYLKILENEDLLGENWKTIIINNCEISCSNMGRIKTISGIKTFGSFVGDYLSISIRGKSYKAHRLVLEAFVPNTDNEKYFVNHINGNKIDNKIENLEWVSSAENNKHAVEILSSYNDIKLAVEAFDANGQILFYFSSISEAARKLKLEIASIHRVCHKRQQTSGGYRWRFKDNNI